MTGSEAKITSMLISPDLWQFLSDEDWEFIAIDLTFYYLSRITETDDWF